MTITREAKQKIVEKGKWEDELFNKDMRWTRIHEMIKMRCLISANDKDYYFERLNDLRQVGKKAV
jgi:hypothetical protein